MNRQEDSVGPACVLILDDDEEVALAMQEVLEPLRHEVRVVHDLDAARSELAARAPDVFLVDLYIGCTRSDELIASVHEELPHVRCVLISGSDRAAWAHLLQRGIVDSALPKPFRIADLIALVERGAK
jgi:DNA-binding NtrC family response regulator